MPMKVRYTSFLGRVVREHRAGTVRDYGRDTLGSTAALYDEAGTKTDEFHYWPYGEVRSHTGSSATPLTYVGTLGYFMDAASRYYVRARVYRADLGRWTSVDPLWPREPAYGYAGGMPNGRVDPSGRWVPLLVGAGGAGGAVGGTLVGAGAAVGTAGLILVIVAVGACGYVIYRAVSPPIDTAPPTTGTGGPGDEDYWGCVETCTRAGMLAGMPPWMWAVVRTGCLNRCLGLLPGGLDEPKLPPPPGGWGGPLPPVGFGAVPGGIGGNLRYE
jgi:RHS repeat-associated protein